MYGREPLLQVLPTVAQLPFQENHDMVQAGVAAAAQALATGHEVPCVSRAVDGGGDGCVNEGLSNGPSRRAARLQRVQSYMAQQAPASPVYVRRNSYVDLRPVCHQVQAPQPPQSADQGAAPAATRPRGKAAGSACRMGRKSDAPRFQALARGGKPLTKKRVLTFLFVGFLVGLGLGFVFMGTVHAVRELAVPPGTDWGPGRRFVPLLPGVAGPQRCGQVLLCHLLLSWITAVHRDWRQQAPWPGGDQPKRRRRGCDAGSWQQRAGQQQRIEQRRQILAHHG